MKKIILVLFYVWANNAFAQTYTSPLYIIFDIDTPPMTRDERKYAMMRAETQPQIRTRKVGKIDTYWYNFGIRIYNGGESLTLDKKDSEPIKTIPLSEVFTQYPNAKTILQVEAEVMPLIEQDFCCKLPYYPGFKTVSYFSSYRPIYVIELDKPNNRAIIVPVQASSPH